MRFGNRDRYVLWAKRGAMQVGDRVARDGTTTTDAIVEAISRDCVVIRTPGGSYRSGIGMYSYAQSRRSVFVDIVWEEDGSSFTGKELIDYTIRPSKYEHEREAAKFNPEWLTAEKK